MASAVVAGSVAVLNEARVSGTERIRWLLQQNSIRTEGGLVATGAGALSLDWQSPQLSPTAVKTAFTQMERTINHQLLLEGCLRAPDERRCTDMG